MLGAAGAALLAAQAANAQSAAATPPSVVTSSAAIPNTTSPPAASAGVSEVVVTGSRIRGIAPVGSSLISVGRDEIQATGALTVTDALQQVPQIFNFGVTESSRGTSGGAGNITYASGIDIRGIGPYATLTLLDGRRVIPSGTGGGIADPSDIPVLALERIEVIADGASAIYGSDAVAGVANMILRRNVEGVEALARYGVADDYDEYQFGIIGGHRWDGGQLTLSYEHDDHSRLSGYSRSFYGANLTTYGGNNYSVAQCTPANIVIKGVSYAAPGLAAGTSNLCDPLKNADLIPAQIRDDFSFTFNQTIAPNIDVFAEGFASSRHFSDHKSLPNGNLTVPSTNAFYLLPAGVTAASETVQSGYGGQGPANNSYGQDKNYQVTAGVDVKLPHDFKLTADYTYGQNTGFSYTDLGVNSAAQAAALASNNPATALNPYGVGAPTSAAVIKSVFSAQQYAPGNQGQQEVEVKLDGPLFHLPGGDVRIAVGGEYDNQFVETGQNTGTVAAPVVSRTHTSEEVKAGYGELFIPIFGAANAIPGFQKLSLDVAGRYEDYSTVGSTTNPKIGLNWSPVLDLTLHASYGTSFRAPLLSQILGASNSLYVQNYTTPGGIVQGVTLSGYKTGNPLTPETATTYSFGGDFSPHAIPGLKLSLNYFNIDYRNQITSYLSNLTILSTPALAAQYASIIVNGAPAQTIVSNLVAQGYPVVGTLPSPVNLFVYGENFNLGVTKTDGLDFTAGYRMRTGIGDVGIGLNGTYFLSYRVGITPTSPLKNDLNHINNPLTLRMRGNVSWSNGPVSATAYVNYENGYTNDLVTPVQNVGSYTTVDVHLGFDLQSYFHSDYLRNTRFLVDVNNLFDTNPPFVNIAESPNGGGGWDPTEANPIGRLVSVAIDKKW